MNREIKFRAFDIKRKRMFPVYGLGHDFATEDTLDGVDPGYNAFHGEDFKQLEIMQFTGFKCINKKNNVDEDIFEGDIFRQTDETDDGDEVTYHVVMWLKERGSFYMIPIDHYNVIRDNGIPKEKEFNWLLDDACLYDFSFDVKLTKVGNIHENPEFINC